ncbi:hypothetical protein V496_07055 [Pseudogymnoascus sp. VKM F-4515 (FW-2607)]|nr:hypothetical protein V496_07055 [Pseudogymnoascus sp. VKM F-4515 (FW-2607)]
MRQFLLLLIAFPALVLGVAILDPPAIKVPDNFGRYAVFFDEVTEFKFEIYAENHTEKSKLITLNSDRSMAEYKASKGPQDYHRRKVSNGLVARQNTCDRIVDCFGQVADNPTASALFIANVVGSRCYSIYSAVKAYWTENNYANLNAVLQGAVVGLIVNIATTPIGDSNLNAAHTVVKDDSGNQCSTNVPRKVADDFSDAIYNFCAAIHAAKSTENQASHFYSGDRDTDNEPTTLGGTLAITKAFIASQGDNFGPICSQYGWIFKRGLESIEAPDVSYIQYAN